MLLFLVMSRLQGREFHFVFKKQIIWVLVKENLFIRGTDLLNSIVARTGLQRRKQVLKEHITRWQKLWQKFTLNILGQNP